MISSLALAQASGYQGKRLSVEYSNLFFSAVINPNANGFYNENDLKIMRIFSFNTRNKISVDYVLDRKTSVGGGIDFFKTRFIFSRSFEVETISNTILSSSDYTKGDLSAMCFNIHYTIFNDRSLPPLGKYSQFELGLIKYKVDYNEDDLFEDLAEHEGINAVEVDLENQNSYTKLYLGYTIGKKRIFFDRLIVNTGLQFCYVPGSNYFSDNTFFGDNSDFSKFTYLENAGKQRIGKHMLLNIKVGVGLLVL